MGVRDDAIDMVDAVGRADDLSLKFRHNMGLGAEERGYSDGRAVAFERPETEGFQLADVDRLLHEHEQKAWHAGYQRAVTETTEALDNQHRAEVSQYVSGMCDLVSRELLAAVVAAAVQAERGKATRQGIVDAVVARVKREAGALDDMAERARRGELFS